MSEDSSSVGDASNAVASEKVPCATEQSTENDENVEKACRDDRCSGKPSSLGMQASEHVCLQDAEGYVDAVMSS